MKHVGGVNPPDTVSVGTTIPNPNTKPERKQTMKHIPLLTVTPVTVEVVRRDDARFVNILAISCGQNNIFLQIGDARRAQRYWNPNTRVSTWILTDVMCRDYSPFPAAMISDETISEVGEIEQGPAALDHIREIWADCPAVRPLIDKILRLFR